MKNFICTLLIVLTAFNLSAQDDSRVITTAVPFLLITPDARAAGMGELGVSTSADAYSQQWNPAKYAFAPQQYGIGVSYTPYLSDLVNDIFLGNITFYNRINEQSAWAASFKYFSLGDIEFNSLVGNDVVSQGTQQPNELALDLSYSLKLSESFSMAIAGRYLNSNLRLQEGGNEVGGRGTVGVDVAGFYQSREIAYGSTNFNGRWRAGFNFSNIGPKLTYDEGGQENFIPSNMKIGGGYDFIFDQDNVLSLNTEFNKLLVPTPPVRDDSGNIIEGQDDDVSFFQGIFQSFGDAPGGFSEELKEFTWAVGVEYTYLDSFAVRTGYFNESDEKGSRKYATLGAGFTYNALDIDISYLFSASQVRNPLENTLRFSLTFNLGEAFDQ
ncbi:type IX secretion system outer membrane channel protein PorV [Spongiivirga citrea]|uniref:Type IX secretion system outer membrane channel protein PorV n=1 Tax=Spongiivirga citrea TaxID=1481457 RepID=A0A6M0CL30_9FLAO|nr:type IX secretion system outer membrane channel protein PorV [Spongiivirga citrea]NER18665.1 type IX secretion system outer membrane channel protein PorV [Spongiivirga citrea]